MVVLGLPRTTHCSSVVCIRIALCNEAAVMLVVYETGWGCFRSKIGLPLSVSLCLVGNLINIGCATTHPSPILPLFDLNRRWG